MNRKFVEIQLSRVEMLKPGSIKNNAQHILSCRLIYPRPGQPEVLSVRPFSDAQFAAGSTTDWSAQQEYKKRILFKEYVEGETQLELEMQVVEQPSLFEQILASAVDKAAGAADQAVIGNVATVVLNLLKREHDVRIIGRGSITLSADEEGEVVQRVSLHAPKPVVVMQKVVREDEDPDDEERVEAVSLAQNELCCNVSVKVLQKFL